MGRILLAAVVLTLGACGDGGRATSSLSRAFCADLDNGLTLMNLWPRDMDPEEFAGDAWGYIATTCPEHYAPNRDYFDSWDLPPVAP